MSLDNEFLVPIAAYAPKIMGTLDEVWLRLLRAAHGAERHTEQGWADLLATYRDGRDLPPPDAQKSVRAAKAGK